MNDGSGRSSTPLIAFGRSLALTALTLVFTVVALSAIMHIVEPIAEDSALPGGFAGYVTILLMFQILLPAASVLWSGFLIAAWITDSFMHRRSMVLAALAASGWYVTGTLLITFLIPQWAVPLSVIGPDWWMLLVLVGSAMAASGVMWLLRSRRPHSRILRTENASTSAA